MKKFLITIALLFLSALPFAKISAQDLTDPSDPGQAPVIEDVPGLRAEFRQYIQDPDSKQIKFEMILHSGIDSDRVRINWTLIGSSQFVDQTQAIRTISVQAGKSYSIPITVTPSGYGVSELRVKAEAFKAANSYLVSIRKNYGSNSSREILPITAQYNQVKIIALVKTLLTVILVLMIVVFMALVGFKRFVRWLNRDDRR